MDFLVIKDQHDRGWISDKERKESKGTNIISQGAWQVMLG